jgi:hypothetical protein
LTDLGARVRKRLPELVTRISELRSNGHQRLVVRNRSFVLGMQGARLRLTEPKEALPIARKPRVRHVSDCRHRRRHGRRYVHLHHASTDNPRREHGSNLHARVNREVRNREAEQALPIKRSGARVTVAAKMKTDNTREALISRRQFRLLVTLPWLVPRRGKRHNPPRIGRGRLLRKEEWSA